MKFLLIFLILPTVSLSLNLTYHITEEKPQNTLVGNIATDGNLRALSGSEFSTLEYSFFSTDPSLSSIFRLDNEGKLYTNVVIDRETVCRYTDLCILSISVIAQSRLGTFFEVIGVKVYVDDINDLTPTFAKSYISLAISESAKVDETFPLIAAVDKDAGKNSLLNYIMTPSHTPFQLDISKNLDGTSDISLKLVKNLDREIKAFYMMLIQAEDGGNPPRSGTLTVKINITDVNDNKPIFLQSAYNVSVSENLPFGSVVAQVEAFDKDSSYNGYIEYSFSSHQTDDVHSIFSINQTTGEILMTGMLSSGTTYHIFVEASDMGNPPKSSQVQVEIFVLDTTNEAPKIKFNLFPAGTGVVRISEFASEGKVVMVMNVIDDDTGENGIVSCFIDNDYFRLQKLGQKSYKIVLAKVFDREVQAEHNVIVTCKDSGSPSLSASSAFVVKVVDENDHRPVFMPEQYSASIQENKGSDALILQVTASDLDEGHNARVKYDLVPQDKLKFAIDPDNGIITAIQPLDHEESSHLTLTVIAYDNGSPSLNSTAYVELDIQDENDNPPKFSQEQYVFYIDENVKSSASLGHVTVTDRDSDRNAEITLTIESYDPVRIPFTLFPNGLLKTNRKLDREDQSQYNFVVMAIDNGLPDKLSSSALVTVNVVDRNDNKPSIVFPNNTNKTVHFSYPKDPNSIITKIKAHDPDEGLNGDLVYKIHGHDDSSLYRVTNRGYVVLAREVEFSDKHTQTLKIEVHDKGNPIHSATTDLNIEIKFTNKTLAILKEKSNEKNKTGNHILIAVVVVSITLFVAGIIIISIWIICRRNKRSNTPVKSTNKNLVYTMGDGDERKMSVLEITNNSKNIVDKDKTIYKVDSMRGAVDSLSQPQNNDPSTFSSFKNVSFQDQLSQKNKDREEKISDKLKMHQSFLQTHGIQWQNETDDKDQDLKKYIELMEKPGECSSSEHSADVTYDSGRGGSEDDVHSNETIQAGVDMGCKQPASSSSSVSDELSSQKSYGNKRQSPFYDPQMAAELENSFQRTYSVRDEENSNQQKNNIPMFERDSARNMSARTDSQGVRTSKKHGPRVYFQNEPRNVSSFEAGRVNRNYPNNTSQMGAYNCRSPTPSHSLSVDSDNISSTGQREQLDNNKPPPRPGTKRIIHNVLV